MDYEVHTIDTIGAYRKEVKAFIAGVVRSKLFVGANGTVDVTVATEDQDDKGLTTFVEVGVNVGNCNMSLATIVPKKVMKKIDKALFDKVAEMYNKRKTFGGMTITMA